MAEEAMNTQTQDTSAVEEKQQETDTDAADNTNQTDGNYAENSAQSTDETHGTENEGQENPPETFLTIKYNKEDVPLSKEEAVKLAQQGKHYFDKLDYIASVKDCSIDDVLKLMAKEIDDKKRDELAEQFGDDEETINLYLEKFHNQNKEKYEKAIADRKLAEEQKETNRISQIGDEFVELQKEFPELKTISDVPKVVIKNAEKMSLEHAYLKYLHQENKKSAEAKQRQQEAENQSTGSMSSENNSADNVADEFIGGIWSR